MAAARGEDGRRLRVLRRSSASPYYCFHDRDVAPGGDELPRVPLEPRRARRRRRGLPGADRRAAAVGHGEPVQPPALPGRRRDEPRPRGLRLRGRPGQAHARGHASASAARTTSCGAGARATTRCSTPTSRREERPARPLPAPRRRAQAQDRVRGHAADRAQADGADQAPVRLRRRDGPRLPGRATGSRASTGSTSRQPRDAGRPQLPPRGRVRDRATASSAASTRTAATPQNGWDTDQFPNSVEDLALPLYEILRGRRLRDRRLQLRRQAAPPEHRPDRPVPRPHRRHRHARAGAARRRGHDRGRRRWRELREARYAGWDGELGRRSSTAARRSTTLEGGSPPARSTRGRVSGRQELLENLVNQAIWAVEPTAEPAVDCRPHGPTSSASTSRRPRRRPS